MEIQALVLSDNSMLKHVQIFAVSIICTSWTLHKSQIRVICVRYVEVRYYCCVRPCIYYNSTIIKFITSGTVNSYSKLSSSPSRTLLPQKTSSLFSFRNSSTNKMTHCSLLSFHINTKINSNYHLWFYSFCVCHENYYTSNLLCLCIQLGCGQHVQQQHVHSVAQTHMLCMCKIYIVIGSAECRSVW